MLNTINEKEIPILALGTWAWGTGINGSKMIFGTSTDENTLKESFRIAFDSGFVLWDTAAVYGMGNAERILGECAKDKQIILSDKYTPGKKFNGKAIDKSLSESTQKFSGVIPDIYWLHMPVNLDKNLEHMCSLLKQKKIGSIGVSNCNMAQIKRAEQILNKHGYSLAGVQNHYSLLYRGSEKAGIIEWCGECNIPFFSYMTLEQGALTGRFNNKKGFPAFSRRSFAFPKSKLKQIEILHTEMETIGGKYNLSIADTAIVWAISKGTVPIVGITKPYQAQTLVKLNNVTLSESDVAQLEMTAEKTGVEVSGSWEKSV